MTQQQPDDPPHRRAIPAASSGDSGAGSTHPDPMGAPDPDGRPALDRALDLVRFLRARCEWDARQTPTSLLPYLLEESHETADAIAGGDDDALRHELGDLLLNVAFQIVLAEERTAFTADDVVDALEAKMRRRHPHLYGDGPAIPWERLKAIEREQAAASDESRAGGRASLLDGIATGLEPLSRAQRLQDRVAAVGFDWPSAGGAADKVAEELAEVREVIAAGDDTELIEEELGDLLFSVVNLTRLAGAHALRAMQKANAKFAGRWRRLEEIAASRGVDIGSAGLDQLEELWGEVKRREG